jgi:hypothetical protein
MPATKKHSRVRNGFGEVVDVDVIVADAVHLAGTQGYHTTNGHVFEGAGGESDTPPVDNPPFSGKQPVRTRATPPTGPAPAGSRPSGQPSTSGASTWQSQSLRTLPVLARTGGARLRTQDGRRGRSATCTDTSAEVRDILEAVAARWAIKEHFHDVKEVWGAGQQQVSLAKSCVRPPGRGVACGFQAMELGSEAQRIRVGARRGGVQW